MYCSECGKKIKPGAKFCSGCGAKVAGAKTEAKENPKTEAERKNETGVRIILDEKTVSEVQEMSETDLNSEATEKAEAEHSYQKFEIKGRRSGAYFLKEKPMTEILVHGEQIDIQTSIYWRKNKYTIMKNEIASVEGKWGPIIYLRDILCILILCMFGPLTGWKTIWGILLDIKLMLGKCIRIRLKNGTDIKIPVGQYLDAFDFLKRIGYEEAVSKEKSREKRQELYAKQERQEKRFNMLFFILAVLMIRSGMGKESLLFMIKNAVGSIAQVETADQYSEMGKRRKFYVTIANHTGKEIQSLCARSPERGGVRLHYECVAADKILNTEEECIAVFDFNKEIAGWELEAADCEGTVIKYENISFAGCDSQDVKIDLLPENSDKGIGRFEVTDRLGAEEDAKADYEDVTEEELISNMEQYDGKKIRVTTERFEVSEGLTTQFGINILSPKEGFYDTEGNKCEIITVGAKGYVEGTFVFSENRIGEAGECQYINADRIILTKTTGDLYDGAQKALENYEEGGN